MDLINYTNNETLSRSEPILLLRFKQVLWGTQVALLIACALTLLRPNGHFWLNVAFLSGFLCVNTLLFAAVRQGAVKRAINYYLWLMAVGVSYLIWTNGGLRDSATLVLPVLLMFVSLFGTTRVFVSIYSLMLLVIVSAGLNPFFAWVPNPLPPFSYHHVLETAIITSVSGIVAWVFSRDMKNALKELWRENLRVTESQQIIRALALYDPLTGLLNRTACADMYQAMLAKLKNNQLVALYFLDLDNFKAINDTFSHSAGDGLLVEIARRLKCLAEEDDLVCRLGGDEFLVVICRDCQFPLALFAQQLLDGVTTPYSICSTDIEVTTSVGVAIAPQDGLAFDAIRKKADIAMYKAKLEGKNRWHFYSAALQQEAKQKSLVIFGIREALRAGQLELHFQPKIDLADQRIVGAEALLRWIRGNGAGVSPDVFIPLIESTNLIHEVGCWVIREACLACREWHEAGFGEMRVSVNVSLAQFGRGNLKEVICTALGDSGLRPEFLELEFTGALLLKDVSSVYRQLEAIKAMGVSLSVGDFGTAHSNLGNLARLQVDTLKLDKSFTSKITTSDEHLAIVTAIIRMAQVLGLNIVAAGVERLGESVVLKELGCHIGQGFYWSEPLPEDGLLALLRLSHASQKVPVRERFPRLLLAS